MKNLMKPLLRFGLTVSVLSLATGVPAGAQVQQRITQRIDNASRVTLPGTRPPKADPALDAGAVAPSMRLQGMALIFSHTPAQQQALSQLIAAQQTPTSPLYHQWLTPETYAAQFGVADSDIAAAEGWLQSQGFSVDSVSRSRDRIFFSGTAAQVESAFGTPIHNFRSPGDPTTHYAPAGDLSVPAALAGSVLTVGNLSSFRPRSHLKRRDPLYSPGPTGSVQPEFTSGQSGSHYIGPGDLDVIYDVNKAYTSGYTGTGQTIVIVGQSEVSNTDITDFWAAAGISGNPILYTLMPGTGSAYYSSGDQAESDLDLEYASTIGKGAQVEFIYTGNNTNYGAFDALQYAVDNKIGTIISSSYGTCEYGLGLTEFQALDAIMEQGVAQGQTILSAAGDDGSTDCYGEYSANSASDYVLSVDYPASSQYVTAMGGSEFLVADTASTNSTYWTSNGTNDVTVSATSYIPEQVWNDDVALGDLSSGGGGASIYSNHPAWQTGTFGGAVIPGSSYRLVPDISLDASNYSAPLLFCSSDINFTGVTGSCTHGFRDANNQYLTVAGGTSFDGPIFSGMLSLINQSVHATTGQGNINPTLYAIANSPSRYTAIFHDITSGGNQCAYYADCTTYASTLYSAATGYDQASGLGSIDLYQLLSCWTCTTVTSTPAIATTTTYSPSYPLSVTPGTNATVTVTVTPSNGFTGAVAFTVTASPTLAYACYSLPNTTVSGSTAATSTLTIETGQTSCGSGYTSLMRGGTVQSAARTPAAPPSHRSPLAAVMAGLLFAGLCLNRRATRKLSTAALSLALLAVLAIGLSGCSSNAPAANTNTSSSPTAAGSYTITVTGTSVTTSTVTSTTTFTVTVL
jgi:subtilase family serine protease